MGDCFVDVSYRGLEVGRRLRMRDFAGDAAYVEAPTPMPVGSSIELTTDAGVKLAAVVARIHEQVGGSERPPGMKIVATVDAAARAWWDARAAEAPAPVEAARPAPVAAPAAAPAAVVTAEATAPASIESGAVAAVAAAAPSSPGAVAEVPASEQGDDPADTQVMHAVPEMDADDGAKRTTVMAAVDIEALLAQGAAAPAASASGSMPAMAAAGDDDEPEIEVSGAAGDDEPSMDGPSPGASGTGAPAADAKKKSRRRRKSRK